MPLYLDRHDGMGATAREVAEAHLRDLEVQHKYGVKYLTYWFDYKVGRAFCLAEAPSAEAASPRRPAPWRPRPSIARPTALSPRR
jgi:hypothetical protein